MKKTNIIILLFITAFVICYLLTAFIMADLNFAKWEQGARIGCVTAFGFLCFIMTPIIAVSLEKEK